MEIIEISYPFFEQKINREAKVLAMGFFDGIHLGHQKVIKHAKEIAKNEHLKLAILTYNHHPAVVYKKLDQDERKYLTISKYKMQIFEKLGVDIVFNVEYDFAFQNQSPAEFVDNFIIGSNTKYAVAGFNHTYGEIDASMINLPDYANEAFEVVTIDPYETNEAEIVSSTKIRNYLKQGNLVKVNHYLGRTFETVGTVVHGYARGRELGYPTANIDQDSLQQLPGIGVYVVTLVIKNKRYIGMASVGKNETFGDENPITVEINIIDFNENIYGNSIKINWVSKIRDQIKFDNVNDLIDQLDDDKKKTIEYFEN